MFRRILLRFVSSSSSRQQQRQHHDNDWVMATMGASLAASGFIVVSNHQTSTIRSMEEELNETKEIVSSLRQPPQTRRIQNDTTTHPSLTRMPSSWILSSSNNSMPTTQCFWNPFGPSSNDDNEKDKSRSNKKIRPKTLTKGGIHTFRSLNIVQEAAQKGPLEKYYEKLQVLGEGTYGTVYLAKHKTTQEIVAIKEIPKRNTNSIAFQQEMRAMMYIAQKGGHPHLCAWQEHFDAPLAYHVVMDAIEGGEVFDNLIEQGTFSEVQAARLVREVASALNFLHGIGMVHADLKPENLLMTSATNRGESVVKLVDFGCAQLVVPKDDNYNDDDDDDDDQKQEPIYAAPTPAYCPRESIDKSCPIQPSADMWALGVILFILLTGAHPFDLTGDATDDEIEARILQYPEKYRLPLHSPKITGHLSKSAKDLLAKLLEADPTKRLTAMQMLQHPWVKGDTVNQSKQQVTKQATIRRFRTKLQAKFLEVAVMASDEDPRYRRKKSLLQRSYQASQESLPQGSPSMDLSDFSTLLGDSIRHRHFPAGKVVYKEGQPGNHMYFIESGSIQVLTKDGSVAVRHPGDFFGEGALLREEGIRSSTITCTTPVHALEISREYFDKYVTTSSNKDLLLNIKEKDKIRRRNHVRTILSLQENMKPLNLKKGQPLFREGDTSEVSDSLFILQEGQIDVTVGNKVVFVAYPGNIIGEHSVLTLQPRNCTATCSSRSGCAAQELLGEDFRKLAEESPHIRATLRDLQLRREFKKAVVRRLKQKFPYGRPEQAFQAALGSGGEVEGGYLDQESVATLMRELHPGYTDEEISEILQTLSLTNETGKVTFEEFKKVFIGDKRTSESM